MIKHPAFNAAAMTAALLQSFGVPGTPEVISEDYSGFTHDRLLAFNAGQFEANNPVETLSNYAVRYTDPLVDQLDTVLQMLSPDVRGGDRSRFIQYPVYLFADAYKVLDNMVDDLRATGADFATVRNTSKNFVTQRIPNRGLAIEVDEDEELLDTDWQQRKVAYLMGILKRTALRRSLALFVAIATAVAKTWDTSAGKDPDQDLLTELENASLRPTRLIMGPGAMTRRRMAHRAQNTAGGFASAGLSDEGIAAYLSIDRAMTVRNRYTTGGSTTSSIFGSYVLLFLAADAMQKDDMSNLKTFWSPTKTGQRYAVYVRQVGDKRWRIAVEKYELTAVTSTAGAEIITVS